MLILLATLLIAISASVQVRGVRHLWLYGSVLPGVVLLVTGWVLGWTQVRWLLGGAITMLLVGSVGVASIYRVQRTLRRQWNERQTGCDYPTLTDEMCELMRDQRILTEHLLVTACAVGGLVAYSLSTLR